METLCIAEDQLTANAFESFWIVALDAIENGYNLREGGSNGRMTSEAIRKCSEALKGRRLSEETKRKIGAAARKNCHFRIDRYRFPADQNAAAKLTWEVVRVLRAVYNRDGYKVAKDLAAKHGIGKTQLWNIVSFQSWKE